MFPLYIYIYIYIAKRFSNPRKDFQKKILKSEKGFPFSDLRIFSLSIPLCEWLTSTPFLLLVYIYIISSVRLKNQLEVYYKQAFDSYVNLPQALTITTSY